MSLLKTKEPGLLPIAVCIPALTACIAMDGASSTNSFAVVMFCGGSLCNRVLRLRTLPTVWCIRLHTAFATGFFALVHTSLMRQLSKSVWNLGRTNSVPGS